MQSLDSTRALHQVVCLDLGKLMTLIRPALTLRPDFLDTLIPLIQESLGGRNITNYIALWDNCTTGKAVPRDSFCFVPEAGCCFLIVPGVRRSSRCGI
jgi:hypothetical protein